MPSEHEYAKHIYENAVDRFVFLRERVTETSLDYVLYSWNGRIWLRNDRSLINDYLSLELGIDNYSITLRNRVLMCLREFYTGCTIRFDSDPFLLGFQNGVLDLRDMIFRESQKTDYITMSTGYDYIPVDRSVLDSLLEEAIPCQKERIDTLKLLSRGLDGESTEHVLFLTRGEGTTLSDLLVNSLGDYASFEKFQSTRHNFLALERQRLLSKRVIVYRDTRHLKLVAEGDPYPTVKNPYTPGLVIVSQQEPVDTNRRVSSVRTLSVDFNSVADHRMAFMSTLLRHYQI